MRRIADPGILGSLIILFPFSLGVAIGGLLGLILSVTLWRASREE